MEDAARILNKLMVGLGFGSGYISQGGDIGSFVAKILAAKYDECKGKPFSSKEKALVSNWGSAHSFPP